MSSINGWQVGDPCRVVFTSDNLPYEADIVSFETKTDGNRFAVVEFYIYGGKQVTPVGELKPSIKAERDALNALQAPKDPVPAQPNEHEKWKVGDQCRAIYSGDSLPYEAKIKEILAGGTEAVVEYVEYELEETVPFSNLLPSLLETVAVEPIAAKEVEPITAKQVEPITAKQVEPITAKQVDPITAKQVDPITAKQVEPITAKQVEPITAKQVEPMDAKPEEVVPTQPIEPIMWKVGDKCQAIYSGDGLPYEAKIKAILASGTEAVVSYCDYEMDETVPLSNLLPSLLTAAVSSVAPEEDRASIEPASKPLWSVGDYCRTVFPEDNQQYEATIVEISANAQEVKISYIGYDMEETVSIEKLLPSRGAAERQTQLVTSQEFLAKENSPIEDGAPPKASEHPVAADVVQISTPSVPTNRMDNTGAPKRGAKHDEPLENLMSPNFRRETAKREVENVVPPKTRAAGTNAAAWKVGDRCQEAGSASGHVWTIKEISEAKNGRKFAIISSPGVGDEQCWISDLVPPKVSLAKFGAQKGAMAQPALESPQKPVVPVPEKPKAAEPEKPKPAVNRANITASVEVNGEKIKLEQSMATIGSNGDIAKTGPILNHAGSSLNHAGSSLNHAGSSLNHAGSSDQFSVGHFCRTFEGLQEVEVLVTQVDKEKKECIVKVMGGDKEFSTPFKKLFPSRGEKARGKQIELLRPKGLESLSISTSFPESVRPTPFIRDTGLLTVPGSRNREPANPVESQPERYVAPLNRSMNISSGSQPERYVAPRSRTMITSSEGQHDGPTAPHNQSIVVSSGGQPPRYFSSYNQSILMATGDPPAGYFAPHNQTTFDQSSALVSRSFLEQPPPPMYLALEESLAKRSELMNQVDELKKVNECVIKTNKELKAKTDKDKETINQLKEKVNQLEENLLVASRNLVAARDERDTMVMDNTELLRRLKAANLELTTLKRNQARMASNFPGPGY